MEEIKEQKLKKVRIEKNIESLEKEADCLSLEAEKKESFQTLSKANALRAKAKSVRAEQLTMVDKSLSDLEKELKVTGGLVSFIVLISQKYNHKQVIDLSVVVYLTCSVVVYPTCRALFLKSKYLILPLNMFK